MNELSFVEDQGIREKVIDRIDVLDKVKSLILLPNTEFASIEMVADYYDVSVEAIKKIATRNNDELVEDGYKSRGKKDIVNEVKGQDVLITSLGQKGTKLSLSNGSSFIIPNRGLRTFPKRAILRVGMLLRDSRVAKEVRTQLLNIVEVAQKRLPQKEVTKAIDDEDALLLKVLHAGDTLARAVALGDYKMFKDRKINYLSDENKVLKQDVDEWDSKDLIRHLINRIANAENVSFGHAWNLMYKDLNFKYHILVKGRRRVHGSQLNSLNNEELSKLAQVTVSRAIEDKIDISEDLKHKSSELKIEEK